MGSTSYNTDGTARPLVMVQPWDAETWRLEALAEALGPDRPVYGLLPPDRAIARGLRTFDDFAAHMANELLMTGLTPPYHLFGWSIGGRVALAVAGLLGNDVEFVGMVDTWLAPPLAPRAQLHHLLNTLVVPGSTPLSSVGAALRRHVMWLNMYARTGFKHAGCTLRRRVSGGRYEPPDWDVREWAVYRSLFSWRPRAVRRPICFLTVDSARAPFGLDPLVDWAGYFQGGLEVVRLSGRHESIWDPPHIGELARQLGSASDRAGHTRLQLNF